MGLPVLVPVGRPWETFSAGAIRGIAEGERRDVIVRTTSAAGRVNVETRDWPVDRKYLLLDLVLRSLPFDTRLPFRCRVTQSTAVVPVGRLAVPLTVLRARSHWVAVGQYRQRCVIISGARTPLSRLRLRPARSIDELEAHHPHLRPSPSSHLASMTSPPERPNWVTSAREAVEAIGPPIYAPGGPFKSEWTLNGWGQTLSGVTDLQAEYRSDGGFTTVRVQTFLTERRRRPVVYLARLLSFALRRQAEFPLAIEAIEHPIEVRLRRVRVPLQCIALSESNCWIAYGPIGHRFIEIEARGIAPQD